MELLNISHYKQLQRLHKGWVENMLESPHNVRDPVWSNNITMGSREYADRIKVALGISGTYNQTTETNGIPGSVYLLSIADKSSLS